MNRRRFLRNGLWVVAPALILPRKSLAQVRLTGAKRAGFSSGSTPAAAGPTWTLVRFTPKSDGGGAITSSTITATGAGNTIVVGLAMAPFATTGTSITDNGTGGANTYAHAGTNYRASDNGGSDWSVELWFAVGTHSTTVVTPTISAGNSLYWMGIWEVSGLNASPLDVSAQVSNQATSINPIGAAVTTANAGEFIAAVCGQAHAITAQFAANEFTFEGVDVTNGLGASHITSTAAAAAAHTPQWVASLTGTFCAVSAAFKL